VYTDGAEEPEGVSIGATLLDPELSDVSDFMRGVPRNSAGAHDVGREVFGGMVPQKVVDYWKKLNDRTRVIHQAELLPAKLALELWADRLAGRRVIVFIDNAAAEGALVKGASTSEASASIVGQFWEMATKATMDIWIARVPSRSNPADGPSREDWAWSSRWGFTRVSPKSWA